MPLLLVSMMMLRLYLGARVSDDLGGRIRVVAVVSGLDESSNLSLV